MDNSCTFLSYNSTGINSTKSKWVRDLLKVTNSDFITLQEHFKKSKTIEKFFQDEFPRYTSYIIPGQRESGTVSGRPKGGLAMLSNREKKVRKERMVSNSYRIQAQTLDIANMKILWINSYMRTIQ